MAEWSASVVLMLVSKIMELLEGNTYGSYPVKSGCQQHKRRNRYSHLADSAKVPYASRLCERILSGAFLIQLRNDASLVRGFAGLFADYPLSAETYRRALLVPK